MPLSTPTLSAALRAALLADPAIQARDHEALTAFCDALAGAIVEHIVDNLEVTTTFAPGEIAVTGTAAAQSNPAPVVGSGEVA